MAMKTALIVLLIANVVPEIGAQCSAIMLQLSGGLSCTSSSTCSAAAPGYFCFSGACCAVQMNCNPGQIVALSDPGMTPLPCSSCPSGFTCVNSMCCRAEASGPSPSPSPSATPAPSPSPSTSCGANQVLVSGSCLNLVAIGASCTNNAQCQGGSFCTASTCTCPTGFSNVNSVCTASQSTSCQTGQVLVNGACLNTVGVNGACTVQAQCPSGATCTSGICSCPTGSSVVNGACVACQSGQVSVNGQCFSLATYGTICAHNEQCSFTNGRCLSGTCSCLSGFTYDGAACSNGCGSGSQQVMVNGHCYNVVGYTGTCQVNEQCNYGFGQCINGACNCAPGYTYSGTYCVSGTTGAGTTCSPTQVVVNNVCYNTALLGQTCIVSAQCTGTPNLSCVGGVCTQATTTGGVPCLGNQVTISGVCYNLAEAGQPCEFPQQCLGGTTCINSVCGSATATTVAGITVGATTVAACPDSQVQFNGRCSSSIGNGCIDYPCISDRCSGVFSSCRYVQSQNNYFCCQPLAVSFLISNPTIASATSPIPIIIATTVLPAGNMPTCKVASARVEAISGAPKNCISSSQSCSPGFACEWNQAYNGGQGQYICCSTGTIDLSPASVPAPATTVEGQMKMYPGSNNPLQCFTNADCSQFPGFANCVLSARFSARVCCTTMSC